MRFRRGLTIRQRQQVRQEIITREIERAQARATMAHLTERCRRAMIITGERPEEARELHEGCRGEEPGGAGCLCLCHDVVTGSVVTGSAALPG